MSDLLTEPRRMPVSRPRASVALLFVAAIAVAVGLAAEVVPAPDHFVRSISITNPLPYQVETEVSTPARDGWLGLGVVEPGRAQAFGEVFDLGTRWVFRFSYAGVHGGDVTASSAELRRSGWRVSVPPEVARRFEVAGLLPSAGLR